MSFVQLPLGPAYFYARLDTDVFPFYEGLVHEVSLDIKVEALRTSELLDFAAPPGLLVFKPSAVEYYTRDYAWPANFTAEAPDAIITGDEKEFVAVGTDADGFTTYAVNYTAVVDVPDPTRQIWVHTRLPAKPTQTIRYTVRGFCVRRGGARVDAKPVPAMYGERYTWLRPAAPGDAELMEQRECPWDAAGGGAGAVRWESVFTANEILAAAAPREGTLRLPENTKVLVGAGSVDPGVRLHRIEIPATSELIFEDAPIAVTVKALLVEGALRIGGPTCRVNGPITITLWGNRTDALDHADHLAGYGSKGIAAVGAGRVDVFGRRFAPTWTRLARTAAAGHDRVYLREAVNWLVGQEVLVVTSAPDDSGEGGGAANTNPPTQNEVMTILAIGDDRQVVQFTGVLQYTHHAGVEYQAEVALLSRNVVIAGTPDDDGAGGHVVIAGEAARGRIAGVLGRRLGQTNIVSRYPFHLHLLEASGENSYFTDNVVRDAYYRCYVIHGTHHAVVRENVAFNTTGHCYYLADGVEENNTIAHNLAVHVRVQGRPARGDADDGTTVYPSFDPQGIRSDDRAVPSDASASGFYMANAYNTVRGNAAVGGWAGFLLPMLPRPIGAYRYDPIRVVPHTRPTLEFTGNTAHSTAWYWEGAAAIYIGGVLEFSDYTLRELLWKTGARGAASVGRYALQNTLVYGANRGVAQRHGVGIEVVTFEFHDVSHVAEVHGGGLYRDGVVTGVSSNTAGGVAAYHHSGFRFIAAAAPAGVSVADVVFQNYSAAAGCYRDSRVAGEPPALEEDPTSCNRTNTVQPSAVWSSGHAIDNAQRLPTPVVRGVTYRDVDPPALLGFKEAESAGSRVFHLLGADGSVTGGGSATVVGSHLAWWHACDDCVLDAAWGVWLCPVAPPHPQGYPARDIARVAFHTPEIAVDDGGIAAPSTSATDAPPCAPLDADTWDYSNCVVGTLSLWGHGAAYGDSERMLPLSANGGSIAGISGGKGWYLSLDAGAPQVLTITPSFVPNTTVLRFATSYPLGTGLTVVGASTSRPGESYVYTAALVLEHVWRDDAGSTYFLDDTGTLYLQPKVPTGWGGTGAAAGERPLQTEYSIVITADCANDTAGFCAAPVARSVPPWDGFCPYDPTAAPPTRAPAAPTARPLLPSGAPPVPMTSAPIPSTVAPVAPDETEILPIILAVVGVVIICAFAALFCHNRPWGRAEFEDGARGPGGPYNAMLSEMQPIPSGGAGNAVPAAVSPRKGIPIPSPGGKPVGAATAAGGRAHGPDVELLGAISPIKKVASVVRAANAAGKQQVAVW